MRILLKIYSLELFLESIHDFLQQLYIYIYIYINIFMGTALSPPAFSSHSSEN